MYYVVDNLRLKLFWHLDQVYILSMAFLIWYFAKKYTFKTSSKS